MGTVSVPNLGPDPFTVNASVLNGKVDPLVTEFNGNIENVNIKSDAAIVASKLNLATIAQVMAMSSKEFLFTKGSDVASGTSITLGTDGNFFDITGTTTIQTITIKQAGSIVFLQFDAALTLTDDTGNLELNGTDVNISAEDLVCLVSDGTNWTMASKYPDTPMTTQGDISFHDGTGEVRLAAGADKTILQSQGSSANPQWISPASVAENLTGTDDEKPVTPASMIGHQGVVKGWIHFDGSGTPSIDDSFNVSGSITDNGTGDYTFSWATDFGGTFYSVAGSGFLTGDQLYFFCESAPAAATINIGFTNHNGSRSDPTEAMVIAIGDR